MQKFARLGNLATVYALFVVRGRFLTRIESDLANAGVWSARAMFCELVATKILRRFAANGPYELVAALTTSWDPLAGAPDSAVKAIRDIIKDDDDMFQPASALEVRRVCAALSRAQIRASRRPFLRSPNTSCLPHWFKRSSMTSGPVSDRFVFTISHAPVLFSLCCAHVHA